MSNNELARAFRMRLEGAGWPEIGAEFGYNSDWVRQAMRQIVCGKARKRLESPAYPDLARYITSRYDGSIKAFSRACGIRDNVLSRMLRGIAKPREKTLDKIRAFAGNVV